MASLSVLPVDHPLLKRFQDALQTFLERTRSKVEQEVRTSQQALVEEKHRRKALGEELSVLQGHLRQQREQLSKLDASISSVATKRWVSQSQLDEMGRSYESAFEIVAHNAKIEKELLDAVERAAGESVLLGQAQQQVDIRMDILKNALQKTEKTRSENEVLKQKQDLFVCRLTSEIDRKHEEIRFLLKQIDEETDLENRLMRDKVPLLDHELEECEKHKKMLLHNWTQVLLFLERQNETEKKRGADVDKVKIQQLELEGSIRGLKKATLEAFNQNEKLVAQVDMEDALCTKLNLETDKITASLEELDMSLFTLLEECTRVEDALKRQKRLQREAKGKVDCRRRALQKHVQSLHAMEDKELQTIQSALRHENVVRHLKRIRSNLDEKGRNVELRVIDLENEVVALRLQLRQTDAEHRASEKNVRVMEESIRSVSASMSNAERDLYSLEVKVGKKKCALDAQRRELTERMFAGTSGCQTIFEEVKSLRKQLEDVGKEEQAIQRAWLLETRRAVELSQKTAQKQEQLKDLVEHGRMADERRKTWNLKQGQGRGEVVMVERTVHDLRNTLTQLDGAVKEEVSTVEQLEGEIKIRKRVLVEEMKEREKEIVEIQDAVSDCEKAQRHLRENIVLTEDEIGGWERKLSLVKEFSAQLAEEEKEGGPVVQLKSEIKRAQSEVRHNHTTIAKLCRQLEASVARREVLDTKGTLETGLLKKKCSRSAGLPPWTTPSCVTPESSKPDRLELLKEEKVVERDSLNSKIEDRQEDIDGLIEEAAGLEADSYLAERERARKKDLVLAKQEMIKHLLALKSATYVRLVKVDEEVEGKLRITKEKNVAINSVLESLQREFPLE